MKVLVISTVRTMLQYNSLKILTGGIRPFERGANGSYTFTKGFQSKRQATEWLRERAKAVALDGLELREMYAQIEQDGMLTSDAATVRIMSIN